MQSKTRVLIVIVLLAFPEICGPTRPAEASGWNLAHAWFTPALTVNADPHCNSILAAAKRKFFATEQSQGDSGVLYEKFGEFVRDSNVDDARHGPTFDDASPNQSTPIVAADGTRTFIYFNTNPGCGGACESQNVIVSSRPNDGTEGKDTVSTPSGSWAVFKAGRGEYYIIGVTGDLEAYRIVSPKRWKLSCSVALEPAASQLNSDATARKVLQSIDALIATTEEISRGSGDCGTLDSAGRYQLYMEQEIHQALYQPWALATAQPPSLTPVSSEVFYQKVYSNLDTWSAGGLIEWRAFGQYNRQYTLTLGALTRFYVEKYKWPEIQSGNIARGALTYAIDDGFVFGDDPFPAAAETELRKAILSHEPISDIETIRPEPDKGSESMLDVAVEYPEALAYLLEKGLDPNQGNAFGKTPLMYAVQYNQPEAVALLLKAGADPNARTIAPSDRCGYTISTTGMTPLHYAARYASAAVIKALVDNGAVTFFPAVNDSARGAFRFPVEWLHKYTTKTSDTRMNPFIRAEEIPSLAALLKVPDDEARAKIAKAKAASAEASYKAGQPEAAYRSLEIALAADPNNQKAISDLPLIALKTGRVEQAAEAAANAIETLKSAPELAAAWFDMGLACERRPEMSLGDGTAYRSGFDYNGSSYCYGDQVWPFMRAWQAQPTPSRAKKLEQILADEPEQGSRSRACTAGSRRFRFEIGEGLDKVDQDSSGKPGAPLGRIYVLHGADENVDGAAIQWLGQPTMQSPRLVGRYVLGDQSVTVLEAPYSQGPVLVDGKPCGQGT